MRTIRRMLGARSTSGRESFTPPACVIYPSHLQVPLATFLLKRKDTQPVRTDKLFLFLCVCLCV